MGHEYHNIDMEGSEPKAGGQSFYIYHDRDGNTHVVDRKSLVPPGQHDIKHVKLPGANAAAGSKAVTPGGIVGMLPPDISSKALEILRQSGEATGAQSGASGGVLELAQAALKSEGLTSPAGDFKPPPTPVLPMVFLAGVVIGAAWALKPFRGPLLKLGMSVVGMWALGSLYIHWMGQQTGLRIASTPAGVVRQAQENAQKMHESMQQEQQALDSLH